MLDYWDYLELLMDEDYDIDELMCRDGTLEYVGDGY